MEIDKDDCQAPALIGRCDIHGKVMMEMEYGDCAMCVNEKKGLKGKRSAPSLQRCGIHPGVVMFGGKCRQCVSKEKKNARLRQRCSIHAGVFHLGSEDEGTE